ncbi:helix-turn-helix domain-containing protein [Cellulomonas hominis]|uniref:helix-turn-helix domain-containing protein n=1 Tax=Cellulomonas hominis TaxID=156981 RepID=UPI001B8FDC55|nr:hypothetical protein CHMI_02011 [Cellulomonas hominis]
MSLVSMVWALKDAPLPNDPVAHLVLIAYADHAKDDGTAAWPSVATVARYARCTPRTVHTKLRLLVEYGVMRPGDQRLVDHLPANRRPVVYDLVMNPGPDDALAPTRSVPAVGRGETAGQAGVKILHPRIQGLQPASVDNPAPGVNPASPQEPAAVENPLVGMNGASPLPVENADLGVKQSSPQGRAWGEAPGAAGVKLSSYKPSLEPSSKNQRLPKSGTSPGVIHSSDGHDSSRRTDLCVLHRGLRVPPRCADCAATRAANDAAQTHEPATCPHGDPGGAGRCALCRRGLLPDVAPWDAVRPTTQTPRSA